ncbi:hypothetical protein [Streptomyces graminilatus]|uniref:hypothetical protein n=1 Tax=Streptomyces graminilatus TaxID=1464070 RepID=UPI0012FEC2F8|nr:hypothetical protein [Streptomyces graminilatus]
MTNYNDPRSIEEMAQKNRELADRRQEALDAKRRRGEKPSEWEERDIRRLREQAASDEEVAQRMRYGPSATHENQSSMNNQAKRWGSEFDTR